MSRRAVKKICTIAFFLWMANFAVFLIGTIVLGGAASGTHPPKDGRYYLLEHGNVNEVSRAVYIYSKIHRDSLWLTLPFAMTAVILTWRLEAKEKRDRAVANSNIGGT